MLRITRELLGRVTDLSPCYYATEPMDNPDYEAFLGDVRELSGRVPQTTTALAEKYPERIRSLISFLGEEAIAQDASLRFSVRSIAQFQRIMKLYSAEEMEYVELIPNNPESVYMYSASGRAVQRKSDLPEKRMVSYSIGCCAGVRVNMVQKTISFEEPELPDQEYPLGVRTRGTVTFQDAQTYRDGLTRLFRSYAFGLLPYWVPIRLNKHVHIEIEEEEIRLEGDDILYRIEKTPVTEAALAQLSEGVPFKELAQKIGIEEAEEQKMYTTLNELYIRGYLRLK